MTNSKAATFTLQRTFDTHKEFNEFIGQRTTFSTTKSELQNNTGLKIRRRHA